MAAVSTLPTSDVASSSSAPPPSSAEVTKPIYRRPRQAAVGSKAGEGAQAVLPQTILGLVDTVLEEGELESALDFLESLYSKSAVPSSMLLLELVALVFSPTTCLAKGHRFPSDLSDPFVASSRTTSLRSFSLLLSIIRTSGPGRLLRCLPLLDRSDAPDVLPFCPSVAQAIGTDNARPDGKHHDDHRESDPAITARAIARCDSIWKVLLEGQAEEERRESWEAWEAYGENGVSSPVRGSKRSFGGAGTRNDRESATRDDRFSGKAWDLLALLVEAWSLDAASRVISVALEGPGWSPYLARQFNRSGGHGTVEGKLLDAIVAAWKDDREDEQADVVTDAEDRRNVGIKLVTLLTDLTVYGKLDPTVFCRDLAIRLGTLSGADLEDFICRLPTEDRQHRLFAIALASRCLESVSVETPPPLSRTGDGSSGGLGSSSGPLSPRKRMGSSAAHLDDASTGTVKDVFPAPSLDHLLTATLSRIPLGTSPSGPRDASPSTGTVGEAPAAKRKPRRAIEAASAVAAQKAQERKDRAGGGIPDADQLGRAEVKHAVLKLYILKLLRPLHLVGDSATAWRTAVEKGQVAKALRTSSVAVDRTLGPGLGGGGGEAGEGGDRMEVDGPKDVWAKADVQVAKAVQLSRRRLEQYVQRSR